MNVSALTEDQIRQIDEASLAILQDTGIEMPHPELLSRFADAGASVDLRTQRVRIPPELVLGCASSAGKHFTISGRDGSQIAQFGAGRRNYNSIAGEALWIEPSGNRRYCRLEDVATAARVADTLPNINIVGAMADPQEVPAAHRCVDVFATAMRNTRKPVLFWFHDRRSAQFINELMVAVRGSEQSAADNPMTYPLLEPISPLRYPFNGVDLLFETSKLNLPVAVGPMAQMGVSAPCTIAGTIAMEHAEVLAGICVTQLVRRGMPVCYGGICHALDMRTTQMIFAGPEQAVFGVALTQMGRRHGFPVYINVGLTDSKRPDAQAGLEIAATLSMGAAAGADIYGHLGICGVDQAASLDMLILQNEIVGYVERLVRPVEVTPDTLAVGEIGEVGPGGTFLDRRHTVRHFRRELWFPDLLDRFFYESWREFGATSLEDRCRMRREELEASAAPPPLDDAIGREVDRVVAAARRDLQAAG